MVGTSNTAKNPKLGSAVELQKKGNVILKTSINSISLPRFNTLALPIALLRCLFLPTSSPLASEPFHSLSDTRLRIKASQRVKTALASEGALLSVSTFECEVERPISRLHTLYAKPLRVHN